MSVGGRHFHHYNIWIGLLTGIGALAIRGAEHHRRHLGTAAVYGTATALIAPRDLVTGHTFSVGSASDLHY